MPAPPDDLRAAYLTHVGNATVLLRFGPFAVLTDPSFLHAGDHVHLGYGLRSKRLVEPALPFSALPPLDLVVLSHLHEDHFDRAAEAALDRSVPIVTTPHAARKLQRKGFVEARGLKTWGRYLREKESVWLQVTSLPAQHGPRGVHHLLPPTMGSMLEFRTHDGEHLWRLYVSGDTLSVEQLEEIPRRFRGSVDLALVHLGGTRVMGVMVTADGDHGVRILQAIDPREAVPIHYDDFDVFKSPLSDFRAKAKAAGLEPRLRYLERGQTYAFELPRGRTSAPAVPPPELWP